MTQAEARDILEALADGCSPFSGEVLPPDHVLMEEEVIEALLIAIEALRGKATGTHIDIPQEEIEIAVSAFRDVNRKPTPNGLAGFFAAARAFKVPELLAHPLYGKYARRYQKGELTDYFDAWVTANLKAAPRQPSTEPHPYFNEPHFNKLTEKAIEQLREKVAGIPMARNEGLSESLIELRKTVPRSHEPWPEEEIRLLTIALDYTNDLEFLGSCFGRSAKAIAAQGNRILEEKQAAT